MGISSLLKSPRTTFHYLSHFSWGLVCVLLLMAYGLTASATVTKPAPTEWVAFGDSITVGFSASSEQTSFIGILEQAVGPIDNQAVGATRIQDQLLTINAYTGKATHVIWLVGYNDMRAGTSLDRVQSDLQSAFERFTARQMIVYVGLCLRMTSEGYAAYGPIWNHGNDAAVEAINEVIRSTVQQYPLVYVIDTAQYDPATGISSDLVHPNDYGHRQIAAAFLSQIALPIYLPIVIYARV